jgi:hypothetical protein
MREKIEILMERLVLNSYNLLAALLWKCSVNHDSGNLTSLIFLTSVDGFE